MDSHRGFSERSVRLRASRGHYIVAEDGGGGAANANRREPGAWEIFTLIDWNGGQLLSGDRIQLRAQSGHYVVAEGGGNHVVSKDKGGDVNANREKASIYEIFTIREVGGDGLISDGDRVSLQVLEGFYFSAVNGGGGALWATSRSVGEHETFVLETADNQR